MRRPLIFATVVVFALMAACSSPEDKANMADAELKQKRLKLADEYQQCTDKAAAYEKAMKDGTADRISTDDQKTKEQCDEIMKMMDALK